MAAVEAFMQHVPLQKTSTTQTTPENNSSPSPGRSSSPSRMVTFPDMAYASDVSEKLDFGLADPSL